MIPKRTLENHNFDMLYSLTTHLITRWRPENHTLELLKWLTELMIARQTPDNHNFDVLYCRIKNLSPRRTPHNQIFERVTIGDQTYDSKAITRKSSILCPSLADQKSDSSNVHICWNGSTNLRFQGELVMSTYTNENAWNSHDRWRPWYIEKQNTR